MNRATSPSWTGLVLAGGQSSRMGRDKASLPWRNGTLLEHARQQLRAAGATRVLTLGRDTGNDALADSAPARGPLSALAQAATQLPDGVYLIVPVDMPLLAVEALRLLAGTQADCARFGEHPLPARLRLESSVRDLLSRMEQGPAQARSLRALQAQLDMRVLDERPWSAQLHGCNTPDEWQALRAAAGLAESDSPDSH